MLKKATIGMGSWGRVENFCLWPQSPLCGSGKRVLLTHSRFFTSLGKAQMLPRVTVNLCEHEVLVTQSCPPLCPPGSSVHGILQARILECIAISFSRGSSRPRDWIRIAVGLFTLWDTREALVNIRCIIISGMLKMKEKMVNLRTGEIGYWNRK